MSKLEEDKNMADLNEPKRSQKLKNVLWFFAAVSVLCSVFGIVFSMTGGKSLGQSSVMSWLFEERTPEIIGLSGFFTTVCVLLLQCYLEARLIFNKLGDGKGGVQQRIDQALEQALSRIDSSVRVRKVSDYPEQIKMSAKRAVKVHNTFVGIRGLDGEVTEPHVLYDEFFKNGEGRIWADLVGIGDFSDERYTRIKSKNGLYVYMLKHSPPMINFIIFFYDDGTKDLYFGWRAEPEAENRGLPLHTGKKKPSDVFYSNSPELVQFFENYYMFLMRSYLWENGEVPQFVLGEKGLEVSAHSSFIDKQGWWITCRTSGISSKITHYALVNFDFGNTGPENQHDIEIFLFDANKKYLLNAAHGTSIAHKGNELHFKWEHKQAEPVEEGYCTYSFWEEGHQHRIGGHVVTKGKAIIGRLSGSRVTPKLSGEIDKLLSQIPNKKNVKKGSRILPDDTKTALEVKLDECIAVKLV